MIIDTPGQIEIFTWSASGAIITDAVASALPTVIAYIVDTPRAVAPATFMSNMLYACRYVAFFPCPRDDSCHPGYDSIPSYPVVSVANKYSSVSFTRPNFRSSSSSTRLMFSHTHLPSSG